MKTFELDCAEKRLVLDHTCIMGVINVTPDSFYENSRCQSMDAILYRAEEMIRAGAEILDIGGESTSKMVRCYGYQTIEQSDASHTAYVGGGHVTTPGDTVDGEEEMERVVPVVEKLAQTFDCVVSVDTSSAMVMKEVCGVGAGMINDIRALMRPGALDIAAELTVPVVLMHSLIEHPKPNFIPFYENVLDSVISYLEDAVQRAVSAGIDKRRLLIDPGFGGGLFGKTPDHDFIMLRHIEAFHQLGLPVLAGMSRKSFIGSVLDKGPKKRLAGSLAAAMLAAQAGVHIIRVHDVEETCDVIKLLDAVRNAQ
ncbi:Dihydropteroate synthase [invertebrate metagenome]|uniref:dihydropteroate synthase n=1 Tax=invertebrate metagenome TaxID=1711999 RepID=A0A2H9T9K0_9ZZZZ